MKSSELGRRCSAPASNTCRLLARDHAAPEPTLALAKAASLGCERVRPLAWCSRPRNSAASLAGALMTTETHEEFSEPILPGKGASDYERYLRTDDLLALQKTPE